MQNQFLTNYTEVTFLEKIKDSLRHCNSFSFSVSFIKKAGLVLLYKDIEAAVERGCIGRLITSTYQNWTNEIMLEAGGFMSSIKYNKLVRDRIPDIIESSGKQCVHTTLSDEE